MCNGCDGGPGRRTFVCTFAPKGVCAIRLCVGAPKDRVGGCWHARSNKLWGASVAAKALEEGEAIDVEWVYESWLLERRCGP